MTELSLQRISNGVTTTSTVASTLSLFLHFSVQEALKVLEFTEEEIRDMFKLLSGVLQLGNIEFMTAGGAQITTKQGQFTCGVNKDMQNLDRCIAEA